MTTTTDSSFRELPKFTKSPVSLVALFIDLLRTHFQYNNTRFKYIRHDPTSSNILIEPSYARERNAASQRPAVYVKRGTFQYAKTHLGHKNTYTKDGKTYYSAQQRGFITILCTSISPLEAEGLAAEISEFLLGMCQVIAKEHNFLVLNVESVGELGQLDGHKETYVVPVGMSFAADYTWSVWEESVKLKRVTLFINEVLDGKIKTEDLIEGNVSLANLFKNEHDPLLLPEDTVENELTVNEPTIETGMADYDCKDC